MKIDKLGLAMAIWNQLSHKPQEGAAGALAFGMQRLEQSFSDRLPLRQRNNLRSSTEGDWLPRSWVRPSQYSAVREMFTLWKATVAMVVEDSRWPNSMPGVRPQALQEAIEAFPQYFMRQHPRDLLALVDNNLLLGWNRSVAADTLINQLRWKYKSQSNGMDGLAVNHVMAGQRENRTHYHRR